MLEPEVLINTAHLRHNLKVLLAHAHPRKIFPVIKANAYGHGLEVIATTIEKEFEESDVPYFCVARVSEARALRLAGVRRRLLVMSHFSSDDLQMTSLIPVDLDLCAHDFCDLQNLLQAAELGSLQKTRIHLNFNTGMNRLGFSATLNDDELTLLMDYVKKLKDASVAIGGLMTHLARGECDPKEYSFEQILKFESIFGRIKSRWSLAEHGPFPAWVHAENSGGLGHHLGSSNKFLTAARPGLHLWGIEAAPKVFGNLGLKPVMSVRAPIRQFFWVKKGEFVGYGSTYRCTKDTLVGTVPLGYADGVPRFFSKTDSKEIPPIGFMVLGKRVNIVGRVSMDLSCVDLTAHPLAKNFLKEALPLSIRPLVWANWIGEGQSVQKIAHEMQTIEYEVLCLVTNRLVRREVQE